MKIHDELPNIVRNVCFHHDAFIVGGFVKYLKGENNNYRDIDVVIPWHEWKKVSMLLAGTGAVVNNFGGMTFKEIHNNKEYSVDMWPDDIGLVLVNYPCEAFHFKTYTYLESKKQ